MLVTLLSKPLSYAIAYVCNGEPLNSGAEATVSRKRQVWVEFYNLPSKRLRVCTGQPAAH